MGKKGKILDYLKKNESVTGKELVGLLGISRQAINRHLIQLVQEGLVIKEGSTRGASYQLSRPGRKRESVKKLKRNFSIKGLEEDIVFRDFANLLNLNSQLGQNAFEIAHYAFTEMLNNAIDHSFSEECFIEACLDQYHFTFLIRDYGVGLFQSIYTKFNLADENAAIGELIKGKTTTWKEKHTGEGIFFTSKSADKLVFRSHGIEVIFDNLKKDIFVNEKKRLKGTEVYFNISKRSRRKLDSVFADFAPEEFDYRFDKTKVQVKLFHSDYVSRSEARRLLHGLEKFKEIILDFSGVKSMGQGFADEIFRVFQNAHPDITLKKINLSQTLEPIINHVVDNK